MTSGMSEDPTPCSVAWRFTVPGAPVPKARPRVVQGRTFTARRTKAYEEAVGWAFRAAHPGVRPIQDAQVSLTLTIHEGKVRPQHRADIDNIEKAVMDALNGIAFEDDVQVVEKHTRLHRWSDDPRVEVEVRQL